MQRLNIQLSRHIQTTRRPRWVVWLLPFLFVFIVCMSYWFATLWFTRDTIYEAAPEKTIISFRFFVGGAKREQVASLFENIPLISNRSIVFEDLIPYTLGEFALFLKEDGTHVIALRTNTLLPQSLLDAQHIVQKRIGKDIVLLSEQPEQTHKLTIAPKILPAVPFPGKTWIGEIVVSDQSKRGWIYNTKNSLVFSIPAKNHTKPFLGVPDNTIAFLSANTADATINSQILAPFVPLIAPIIGTDTKDYLNRLSNNADNIFLTKDGNGVGFFLTAKSSNDHEQIDIRKLLQSVSALNTPKIQKTSLPDGTFMQELISDPDSVSVEQVTVLGLPMYRVETNHQTMLAGFTDDKHLIMTNRENLLRFYKEQTKKKTQHTICGANNLGISLEQISDLVKSHANFVQSTSFGQLSEQFASIGIVNKMYSTRINVCKR